VDEDLSTAFCATRDVIESEGTALRPLEQRRHSISTIAVDMQGCSALGCRSLWLFEVIGNQSR
jgi:hypothetical protein